MLTELNTDERTDGSWNEGTHWPEEASSSRPAPAAQRTTRDRSTILFPYGALNDAVEVARALSGLGVDQCTLSDLAAKMGYSSTTSGTFRLKVATARIFGVVTTQRQMAALTPLGRRLASPEECRRARVEAFLAVPLYQALYERFRGQLLPQDAAIESEIVKLGVAQKQKDKARQAFQRSAAQAGLLVDGRERLEIPPDLLDTVQPKPASTRPPAQAGSMPDAGRSEVRSMDVDGNLHPAIRGLLATLPPPGSRWPARQQEQWLSAVKSIFGLIYGSDERC